MVRTNRSSGSPIATAKARSNRQPTALVSSKYRTSVGRSSGMKPGHRFGATPCASGAPASVAVSSPQTKLSFRSGRAPWYIFASPARTKPRCQAFTTTCFLSSSARA